MELEHIKELWQTETVSTPEISLEKQKEIRMPLEKIRKNMRMEFWATVGITLVLIPLTPYIFIMTKSERFAIYYLAFLISSLFIITFYFQKFFKLYKDLEIIDFKTKESLKDLLWKFKLNEQYYLSFYVAGMPVLLFEFALLMDYIAILKSLYGFTFMIVFLMILLVSLFAVYFFGKAWFRNYYGKYINQIQKTLQIMEIHENAVN